MPRALDPQKRAHARRLRKQGDSLNEIMRALGISYGSAQRFTKGVCPEKERPPEVGAKIAAAKESAHEEWKRTAPRGECGTPSCDRPGCRVAFGKCHCGCDADAPLAPDDDRTRKSVRGEPRLYTRRCQRSADTLMAADNGEPLLNALKLADLSRIEVTRLAKPRLGKGVVADLVGLDGYRLGRERCERIVVVLRAAFEEKGLDATGLTLERLFTYGRPANEPPAGERARRVERRRPPIPATERGDGRHFRADAERLRQEAERAGLWIHDKAAAELKLPRSTLSALRDRAGLETRELRVGTCRARVYVPRVARAMARDLLTSEAAWDLWRRDPDAVAWWYRTHHGASLSDARAVAAQVVARNTAWRQIRVGTGRPKSSGPPAYHHEWEQRFREIAAELQERYVVDVANGFDDPPPTKWEIARLVAYEDFEVHPERWDYDPEHHPREAAARVWRAVKPLQIARTETRIA